ncbi:MAG: glycosyltransferase family 2 protein, partial [bacterium]
MHDSNGEVKTAVGGEQPPAELEHATSPVLISVIIPCRNERLYITRCLHDLESQVDLPGEMEVIIADGRSDDGTREILDEFCRDRPRYRVIDNPQRITPAALNLAIQAARGQYLVRMDVHTSYAQDYIAQCVAVKRRTGAANVGGATRTRVEGKVPRAIAAVHGSRFGVGGASSHFPEFEGPVDTVPFGCWERDLFVEIGLFDESLVRNQDDEFNLRISRHGGVIWQSPTIQLWYQPRSSLRQLFRQYYQYGFWKVVVIRKHHLPASWRHLVPVGLILALVLLPLLGLLWPV